MGRQRVSDKLSFDPYLQTAGLPDNSVSREEKMKTRLVAGLAVLIVMLVLGVSTAGAASKVQFQESFVDKVVTFWEEGEPWYEEVSKGTFTATYKLDLSSIFPDTTTGNITKQLNGDTCFDISIGAVGEYFCLGEGGDVKYTEGAKSATVKRREDIGEDTEQWITVMKTTATWTAKNTLKITIAGKAAWVGWILADYYDGETNPTIVDTTEASVIVSGDFTDKNGDSISSIYATSDSVSVTGTANTRFVTKGQGDYQEEFELTTVNLTGKGEPTVSAE